MLLNQYSPVPRAQLDCWEGRLVGVRVARAKIYHLCRLRKQPVIYENSKNFARGVAEDAEQFLSTMPCNLNPNQYLTGSPDGQ